MRKNKRQPFWPKRRYDRCGEPIPTIFDIPAIIGMVLFLWFFGEWVLYFMFWCLIKVMVG